ncbi:MAG TPA: type II toxin-antitoxin system RelE/ParE family toxin [bacterium]|nr:type II toxin-antitoxin system RelE/ParE family toxin [bacterium]HQL61662.1 type II toxin-antitoxin system RelE/ParE family toxin [bacterium]
MRVHWTNTAPEHLEAIHDYIARDSTTYARQLVHRLTRKSQQIVNFPFSGRKVPKYDSDRTREVIEFPYRIIYFIKSDRIDVLAVIHGARDILQTPEECD